MNMAPSFQVKCFLLQKVNLLFIYCYCII